MWQSLPRPPNHSCSPYKGAHSRRVAACAWFIRSFHESLPVFVRRCLYSASALPRLCFAFLRFVSATSLASLYLLFASSLSALLCLSSDSSLPLLYRNLSLDIWNLYCGLCYQVSYARSCVNSLSLRPLVEWRHIARGCNGSH